MQMKCESNNIFSSVWIAQHSVLCLFSSTENLWAGWGTFACFRARDIFRASQGGKHLGESFYYYCSLSYRCTIIQWKSMLYTSTFTSPNFRIFRFSLFSSETLAHLVNIGVRFVWQNSLFRMIKMEIVEKGNWTNEAQQQQH